MKKRVLLKDIADELGVSATLVSMVINNKTKEGRVGKEMARKIRETAKKLNYQPNYIAQSLRRKKTNTIGLVVADISNPFFSKLARIVEDEASKNEYTVIIGSSDEDSKRMEKIIGSLISRQVDGFIIVPTEGSYKQICNLKHNAIPFVLMDRTFESISANHVMINNFQASQEASEYLFSKGYKKVGLIAYKSSLSHFNDRINGYREALKTYNILPDNNLIKKVKYSNLQQDIIEAVTDLTENKNVEAIYFTTNTLALEGLKCLFRMGKQIPNNLDVLTFDHSDAYYFFQHPIPHVSQPIQEMAKEAVRLLIDQMEGNVNRINKIYLKASLEIECLLKMD